MTLVANLEPLRWIFLAAAFGVVFWLLMRTQRQIQRGRAEGPAWPVPTATPAPARHDAAAGRGSAVRSASRASPPGAVHSPGADAMDEVRQAEIQLHELARGLIAQIDSKAALLAGLLRAAQAEADRLERLLASRAGTQAAALASATSTRRDAAHDPPPPVASAARPISEIHRLAELGLTPAEIAEQTGCPQGEVELIMGLKRHAAS
jgi:hypothetical protein